MRWIWEPENLEHLASHGVSPDMAEAIFDSEDACFAPSESGKGRIVCEGSIGDRLYRLIFCRVGEGELYAITAFRIRKRA